MVRNVIVLDTHVLVWRSAAPERLSSAARDAYEDGRRRGCFVSAISIWEIAMKLARGTLHLGRLALRWTHRDPADRVIVATALAKGVSLITADDEIRAFEGVHTIW